MQKKKKNWCPAPKPHKEMDAHHLLSYIWPYWLERTSTVVFHATFHILTTSFLTYSLLLIFIHFTPS